MHFAREVAYTYTKPLEKYHNPRGGHVPGRAVSGFRKRSAWRAQTGATPDGRLAHTPPLQMV